jgi:hypothetical protein
MSNRIALSDDRHPSGAHRGLKAIAVVAATFALASAVPSAALATRVPAREPRIPNTVVACFHEKTHQFTAEIRPAGCDLVGTEGRQRKPAKLLIKNIKWDFWGTFSSRGSLGLNVRTGAHVRLFAFRRVECRDGRVWYSSVVAFNPGNSHITVLRLPTCDALP